MSDSFTRETLIHTQLRKINFLQHFFLLLVLSIKNLFHSDSSEVLELVALLEATRYFIFGDFDKLYKVFCFSDLLSHKLSFSTNFSLYTLNN